MAKTVKVNKAFVEAYVQESGYPEVGAEVVAEKSNLQKFYKHLTDAQLQEWIELEGLEYNPSDSEPINRMRMCMAILYKHFPKAPSEKKQSKYAKYSLEDLMNLALQNDVVFEDTDDERILRMRAIMALRAAKIID